MILIIRADGEVLPLDLVTGVSVSNSVTTPQHPMEEGADAIEHSHLKNTERIFSCKVTESPTAGQANLDLGVWGLNTLRGITGPSRVEYAEVFLKACVGQLVDVVSTDDRFSYTGMLLTKFPFQWRVLRGSPFTIGFTEPRLVRPGRVRVPPRRRVPATISDDLTEAEQAYVEELEVDQSITHRHFFGQIED